MIKLISINSFKSFVRQDISFSALTLFSGLNNSGKSSIIQALRMMGRASIGKTPLLDGHGKVADINLSHLHRRLTLLFKQHLQKD